MRPSASVIPAVMLLALAPAVHAQTLPGECYRVAASRPGLPYPPPLPLGFQDSLRSAIASSTAAADPKPPADPDPVNTLWAGNPSMTALALAVLVSDPPRFPLELRNAAAARYAELSGAPYPILYVASGIMDQRVWEEALRLIRRPLSATEETLVFFWACNAGWQLTAFRADTLFATAWRAHPATLWPADAAGLIRVAAPLIRGPLSSAMQALLHSSVPDSLPFAE